MKNAFTLSALMTAMCFGAGAAQSEIQSIQIHSYKHWTVDYLYSDEGDGWNACSMSVFGDDIGLSVNVDGNEDVEIQIYDGKANYSQWRDGDKFQIKIDSFAKWDMPATGRGNSLFVELDLDNGNDSATRLIHEIRQGFKLSVYEYGEREEFYWFSLHGSKAATNALAEKCLDHLKPFSYAAHEREPNKLPVPGKDSPVPGMPSAYYDLRLEDTSVGKVLYFNGSISTGFSDDVKSYGNIDYFVIEQSNGGLLWEALQAGAHFRANGIATSVDGPCASACVELFADGVERYYSENAQFGSHAMAVDGDEMSLATTQHLLSDRVKYFEAGGVDPEIVIDSLDTPAEQIRWLSPAEAREYGLID